MNKTIFTQIISTSLTASLGISSLIFTSPGRANTVQLTNQSEIEPKELNTIATSSTETITEFLPTKIYQHPIGDRDAATLYFLNLPLLTFLGDSSSNSPENTNLENNPLSRAGRLAARLDELYQQKADPNKITVSWNQEQRAYSINFAGEQLIAIDRQTVLPDTTKNLELDALQATNRLRRLLGGAPPLKKVSGNPNPQAQEKLVATASVKSNSGRSYQGIASWYGPGFHGRPTASGERFNSNALTAAHRSLPFGTKVKVTNLNNGRSVVVRINDRGPFSRGRIIDLSAGAAKVIGVHGSGTAPVRVQVIGR